jgi:hypothetical protein
MLWFQVVISILLFLIAGISATFCIIFLRSPILWPHKLKKAEEIQVAAVEIEKAKITLDSHKVSSRIVVDTIKRDQDDSLDKLRQLRGRK